MTDKSGAGKQAPHSTKTPAGQDASDPSSSQQVVRIGSPTALLAIVPQLLTFEPEDSIVLLGAEPPRGRVRLTVRFDLPKAPDLALADEIARRALGVLVAQ